MFRITYLTLLLHCPDTLQLLDDSGEGVGDDGDHDKEGEEEDADGGHDELDIHAGDTPVLIQAVLAAHRITRQDRPRFLSSKR